MPVELELAIPLIEPQVVQESMPVIARVAASAFVHPTATIEPGSSIGEGVRIWRHSQIRRGASVGEQCVIGKGVYVDHDVLIGARVKIENNASIFYGAVLEDGVFVGPYACLTNDRLPRAITPGGALKGEEDWVAGRTLVRYGASIGAGAVVVTGVTIGRWAMVGAGAVVTRDVPDHGLVLGTPARLVGHVCRCGRRLVEDAPAWRCPACDTSYSPPTTMSPAEARAARHAPAGLAQLVVG